jgi:hypothetical protein
VIVKPNARLCERWVTHQNLSRAAEQRLTQPITRHKSCKNSIAAPRLQNYGDCLPKARRLALGLALAAAPQLIAQLTQVTRALLFFVTGSGFSLLILVMQNGLAGKLDLVALLADALHEDLLSFL